MGERQRISFRTDEPQLLTLSRNPPGMQVHGRRGEVDYMYTVMGESGAEAVIFLPAQAAADLDRTQAKEGHSIQITKRKGPWEIIHVVEEPQPHAYQQNAQPQPARTAAAPPSFGYGNGQHSPPPPASQARPQPAPLPAQSSTASMYSRYLCAAIDAWCLASQYAKEKGMPLNPSSEDIRATAATFYIAAQRENN